jgi:uncharacterized protein (TIGR02588 family)
MKKKQIEKNWLEWSVFAAGLLLVAGVLGFLAYEGATATGGPPQIEIELGQAEPRGGAFIVPVRVTNGGGETAEGVVVEVLLEGAGGAVERGEFGLAFLPRRSTREGFVTFHADPRAGRLRARALGYEKP